MRIHTIDSSVTARRATPLAVALVALAAGSRVVIAAPPGTGAPTVAPPRVAAPRSSDAPPVRHVPPADGESGQTLELVADASATTATLTAHIRIAGQVAFEVVEMVRRDDAHWVAVVPPAFVVPPGIDYYLDAGGQPVFASIDAPHRIPVHVAADTDRKARDLARNHGRRNHVHTMAEWTDYGTRTVNNQKLADNYYRIDADYTYRLWAYPLEDLRIGYTRLLGTTEAATCTGPSPCTAQAGFKVGGWFELGLAPIEGVRFDGRVMFLATKDGFNIGGRGEARVGVMDGNHVAIGVEHLADVGTSGYFRLGWGTVPMWPMMATVEVTDMPSTNRPTGVRLYYDLARDLGNGVRLGIRAGYAARTSSIIGFTGGAGLSVDF